MHRWQFLHFACLSPSVDCCRVWLTTQQQRRRLLASLHGKNRRHYSSRVSSAKEFFSPIFLKETIFGSNHWRRFDCSASKPTSFAIGRLIVNPKLGLKRVQFSSRKRQGNSEKTPVFWGDDATIFRVFHQQTTFELKNPDSQLDQSSNNDGKKA